jgi:hypothetical protein
MLGSWMFIVLSPVGGVSETGRQRCASCSNTPARWDGRGSSRSAGIALPLRAIAGLADVQDSGSAGGEAGGGRGLGLLTITTRERRGLRYVTRARGWS